MCAQPDNALQRFPRASPPPPASLTLIAQKNIPILNNPEKNSRGFSFTVKPLLSLHLFFCCLSVLIRPLVISALLSCFLFTLNHIPGSSSILSFGVFLLSLPPSPLLWRKKGGVALFIYISCSLTHLNCIKPNTITPKPSTFPLNPPVSRQFHNSLPCFKKKSYLRLS